MKLEIHLAENKITLFLKEKGKIVSRSGWREENNLSQRLLPEIDKLLKKNKIKKESVQKAEVKTDIPAGFTTARIAKSVANAWNFARSKKP